MKCAIETKQYDGLFHIVTPFTACGTRRFVPFLGWVSRENKHVMSIFGVSADVQDVDVALLIATLTVKRQKYKNRSDDFSSRL